MTYSAQIAPNPNPNQKRWLIRILDSNYPTVEGMTYYASTRRGAERVARRGVKAGNAYLSRQAAIENAEWEDV